MDTPLWQLDENEIRSRSRKRMHDLTHDTSGDFFVYVLECEPEIRLRKEIEAYDGKGIVEAVQEGKDAWLDYPAKIRPPIGDHQSNFPNWVEQAVEADEVYYVGQTLDPVDRIAEHATGGDNSAYATRLFPPKSIIHMERVQDREEAKALEDLIAQVISFGCEIESEHYTGYGSVPERLHERLEKFADPDGPELEIENGRNLATFHAAPNDYWTFYLMSYITELPSPMAPWDTHEEFDAYPIEESIVVDWYLTSLESAARASSFQYQEDLLMKHIEKFEEWLESSDEYPERGDPEDNYWDADEGIDSTEEGKQYFWQLHEIAQEWIVEPFLAEYREETRSMHPSPLRFAYSDKSPNVSLKSGPEGSTLTSSEQGGKKGTSTEPLTNEERARLEDVIELAPTSNGELQDRWGFDESADVHHYLEDHLSEWYYRDADSRIRPTDDAEDQL
ncbi:DUF5797 family protein [Natrinema sp. 1APR25-10V2]|uniref:DUF5797 family protein n=1 Tax=Natrinema sp. 1APR25-10V2 TaxID=2951081 RepID=UPI002874806E|nr:DUF5797 family protein [Natrinema sp. 1APR25-10V2]MDS0473792.1 DUF5797 family protein [Natrinema sp. 1APR25-10V2]